MESQHVFDLLPEYALGTLSKDKAFEVESHLETCRQCREDLQGYKNVVNELPLATKMSQPPGYLKSEVMELIRTDNKQESTKDLSSWEHFRELFIRRAPLWGALSLVIILILAISNLLLWQRVNNLSMSHHELDTVGLSGTEATPQAVGMLVMSEDGDYGVLVVDGLPELPADQQYQLWLIEDGERTSGGVFSVNEEGYGTIVISSQESLTIYQAFGVTIEPAGGSPGPTGMKVLGGDSS